jgi:hypothetical protein
VAPAVRRPAGLALWVLGLDGYGGGCKGSDEEDGELHVGGAVDASRLGFGSRRGSSSVV